MRTKELIKSEVLIAMEKLNALEPLIYLDRFFKEHQDEVMTFNGFDRNTDCAELSRLEFPRYFAVIQRYIIFWNRSIYHQGRVHGDASGLGLTPHLFFEIAPIR